MSIADLAKLIIILIIFTLPEYSPRLVKVEKFYEEEIREDLVEEEKIEEVPIIKEKIEEPKKLQKKIRLKEVPQKLKPPIREFPIPAPKPPLEERKIVEAPKLEEKVVEERKEIEEVRGERILLVVLDLQGDKNREVTGWLVKSLLKTGRFNVLRMSSSTDIVADAELAISGRVSKDTLWSVDLTLVRLPSEVVVLMDTIQGTRGEIKVWIDRFVENVLLKFPILRGRIIEKDSSLAVDLGSKDGVVVGMNFFVYRLIGLRRHPESARIMGLKFQDIGVIKVTSVGRAASSVEIVHLLPGKSIEVGDFVLSR